ncbi:hypothetical protein FSBG_01606 [Fusobacterium gonidiaformans 3-1-5R]|uniref:Uncharacterized protein n=1 Tax=Fusobacterium gonidiaformans 3-1-5R TaxID=469605 RepID=E5BHY6_9FUSO|nr:hypothetical protein [Fusobacterium gonidiaformans]EFS22109.1 hypothetical protein FSBG_01606 [Fusobacterium gonidiaformans 3-1-5R]
MEDLKLKRGTSFIEFYYRGLSITNSKELAAYIKINKWYFDRAKPEVQEQFRRLYRIYKKQEKKNEKKN